MECISPLEHILVKYTKNTKWVLMNMVPTSEYILCEPDELTSFYE